MGGPAIGRAFDTGIVTGDRGIGGFAELAYRPVASGALEQSETYLFVDAGKLTLYGRGAFPRESISLASVGGGLRLNYKQRVQVGVL